MLINVLYDSGLTNNESNSIRTAAAELATFFTEQGLGDIQFRLLGKSRWAIGFETLEADALLDDAKKILGRMGINRKRDVLIDANDLADLLAEQKLLSKEPGLTLFVTSSQIITQEIGISDYRRYTFSSGNVCIISVFPYRDMKLSDNDIYRLVKFTFQRQVGLMLGALKHRRAKVAWRYGEPHCVSANCVMGLCDSIIQKIGLAMRTDSAHEIFCPHCAKYIKRYYHTPEARS